MANVVENIGEVGRRIGGIIDWHTIVTTVVTVAIGLVALGFIARDYIEAIENLPEMYQAHQQTIEYHNDARSIYLSDRESYQMVYAPVREIIHHLDATDECSYQEFDQYISNAVRIDELNFRISALRNSNEIYATVLQIFGEVNDEEHVRFLPTFQNFITENNSGIDHFQTLRDSLVSDLHSASERMRDCT